MSVILVAEGGEDLQVNWWHWRTILALMRRRGLIDEEQRERMGCNGAGGQMDAVQAQRAAEDLRAFAETMPPDQRLLLDGSFTSEPKSMEIFQGDQDYRNYSTNREVLTEFAQFCRESKGVKVV